MQLPSKFNTMEIKEFYWVLDIRITFLIKKNIFNSMHISLIVQFDAIYQNKYCKTTHKIYSILSFIITKYTMSLSGIVKIVVPPESLQSAK